MSYTLKDSPKVIFILGPTGTGKSDLALRAARRYGGEIINCDSVQMFEAVDIGTAKPTQEQMHGIPHHLLGHVAVGGTYTATQFYRDALSVIERRAAEGVKIFYVVGGSGFYIQALEKGAFPGEAADPIIRKEIETEIAENGLEFAFADLIGRDPEYAGKIGPNDRYRIGRALEVLRAGRFKTMKEVQREFRAVEHPFLMYKIGLNRRRSVLRLSVETRTQQMIECGIIEETQTLRAKGFSQWAPLLSVGYKETQMFLDGKMQKSILETAIVTSTMQLAKRQMTWFRRDPNIYWFDPDFSREAPVKLIFELVRTELSDNFSY